VSEPSAPDSGPPNAAEPDGRPGDPPRQVEEAAAAAEETAVADPAQAEKPEATDEDESPPADGQIDESALSPEQRQKLRVLRRITGGRVSDAELLARLEGETGDDSASGGGKRKKGRWWGG